MQIMNFSNNNLTFEAGLTKQIASEINNCSISAITDNFAARNITTNFDNNKIIAWCAAKSMEIIDTLNEKYNFKLNLPNEIYMNNNLFSNKEDLGMCLALPYLSKDTNKIYPETTIFFNSKSDWKNIDNIADKQYSKNYSPTNSFINIILHEFIHAAHFKRLIDKLGTNKYVGSIVKIESVQDYTFKKYYDNIINQLGIYATTNPLEAIACDLSKRICDVLDKTSLLPQSNPLKDSPYINKTAFKKFYSFLFDDKFTKLMTKYWNGKFN